MKSKSNHALTFATLLLAALIVGNQAQGSVVNIDYSSNGKVQSGAIGAFSTGGTSWNGVSGEAALSDEFGTKTGVSVSQWKVVGCSGDVQSARQLFADTMFVDSQEGGNDSHAITGLTAGNLYDIAVYGGRKTDKLASQAAIIHEGGTAESELFGYTPGSDGALPLKKGEHYVTFLGLTPMDLGDGEFGFIITTAKTNGFTNVLTGLQLRDSLQGDGDLSKDILESSSTHAPEPATLTIWGLGALGCALAAFRRGKRAAA